MDVIKINPFNDIKAFKEELMSMDDFSEKDFDFSFGTMCEVSKSFNRYAVEFKPSMYIYDIENSKPYRFIALLFKEMKDFSNFISVSDNNITAKYDNGDISIFSREERFDDNIEFIARFVMSFYKEDSDTFFKSFSFNSTNCKFGASSKESFNFEVYKGTQKLVIRDGLLKEFSMFFDMQDKVLEFLCEMRELVSMTRVIEKYFELVLTPEWINDNRRLYLDLMSWYVILGGEKVDYSKFDESSFVLSEQMACLPNSLWYYNNTVKYDNLKYIPENGSVFVGLDTTDFYYGDEEFQKKHIYESDRNKDNWFLGDYDKKIIKSSRIDVEHIMKILSNMERMGRSELGLTYEVRLICGYNYGISKKGSSVTVIIPEINEINLEEFRFISAVTGWDIIIGTDKKYYDVKDGNIKIRNKMIY